VSDIVKGLREAASGQGGLDYGDLWACCDEAADEIERLEAELAEARREAACLQSQVNAFYAGNPKGGIVQRLEDELAEARREIRSLSVFATETLKNDERYRYLRTLWKRDHFATTVQLDGDPASCDAAIDAARKETP